MDPSVAGALISAAASIVVAWIGYLQQTAEKRKSQRSVSAAPAAQTRPAVRLWLGVAGFLSIGALAATLFIHHDLGANVIVLSPLVFAVLAFVQPIQPLIASAISLIPFPFAFASEPLYRAIHGSGASLGGFTARHLVIWLGFATASAVGSALICWWRRRSPVTDAASFGPAPQVAVDAGRDSTDEIARLWQLHREGALNQAEFERAKKRILSGSG